MRRRKGECSKLEPCLPVLYGKGRSRHSCPPAAALESCHDDLQRKSTGHDVQMPSLADDRRRSSLRQSAGCGRCALAQDRAGGGGFQDAFRHRLYRPGPERGQPLPHVDDRQGVGRLRQRRRPCRPSNASSGPCRAGRWLRCFGRGKPPSGDSGPCKRSATAGWFGTPCPARSTPNRSTWKTWSAGWGFPRTSRGRTGMPLPLDAKMTDVASHTWILATILKRAGVEFLHIGSNSESASPELPRLFWWEGPDGSRLLDDVHGRGLRHGRCTRPPAGPARPGWP